MKYYEKEKRNFGYRQYCAQLNFYSYGQGVSISADGSTANNSAMLDIISSDKGILIPRITLDDASTASPISSPATGLMIYNENGTEPIGFYHWDGSVWQKLFDANGDDNDWILSGNNMYSAVSGNVGLGTSSPAFNFHILDGAPTLLIEASEEADASLLFRDYQDASTQNFDDQHLAQLMKAYTSAVTENPGHDYYARRHSDDSQ